MILTAYLDESGTHDGSPVGILAGYVGHSGQWRKFEKKWARMLGKFDLTHLHTKDFAKRSGEFRGWTDERKNSLVDHVDRACENHSLFGFSARLVRDDYLQHYIAGKRPRKFQADTEYGLCFRLGLSVFPNMIAQVLDPSKVTFNIVMESGHRHAGDAKRLFDLYKQTAPRELARMAGAISFADKMECYGVQAADTLAYSAFKAEQRGEVDLVRFSWSDCDAWADAREYVEGKRPCFRLNATPNVLRELRENLWAQEAARLQYGRRWSVDRPDGRGMARLHFPDSVLASDGTD